MYKNCDLHFVRAEDIKKLSSVARDSSQAEFPLLTPAVLGSILTTDKFRTPNF